MEEGSAGLKIDNPSVSVERWGLFLHNFFQLLQQMKEILVIIWRDRENVVILWAEKIKRKLMKSK